MRIERSGREGAEKALQKTYDQVPVAFFTADATGRLLRGNPALGRLLGDNVLDGNTRWQDYFEPGTWESLSNLLAEGPRAPTALPVARPRRLVRGPALRSAKA
jgi:PAS domain-containing protein